jgi:Tol biopolymer transport system component
MKNHYYLLPLVLLFSHCRLHSQKTYDVAYSNYHGIIVHSVADNKEDTLHFVAHNPDISPDGAQLAYTRYRANEVRQIEILDFENGKTRILDSACKICYGPVWSPDGKHLAYNADLDGHWSILLLSPEGTADPVNLSAALNETGEAYSPTWSDDGKKILVQDMKDIFILDTTGKIIERIPIKQLRKNPSISSGSKYLLNKEENAIIFDMELDGTFEQDNPPIGIFVYDRRTQTTRMVSPKGYDCFEPFLKGDRIFFTGDKEGDPQSTDEHPVFNTYSSAINGSDFRLEYKNRRDFSCKR